MEKNLVFRHGNFTAVVREPGRIKSKDYPLDLVENMPNFRFRERRYSEYSDLGFPIWIRTKMRGIKLPVYERQVRFKLENLDSILECGDLNLVEEMDFEGSDRKYTLLVDVFHNSGFCSRISGDERASVDVEVENGAFDENLLVLEEDSNLYLVRYVHGVGTRISNDRFWLKKNSKLVLYDVVNLEGLNISNSFFKLDEGSQLEHHQVLVGGTRNVAFSMFKTEEGARVIAYPRIVRSDGISDVMYVGKIIGGESDISVKGKGFVSTGKIVFRGVMDIPKGVKGSQARESFRCVLLDERAEFDTIPSLFVEENEVVAEHGASSSPISDEEKYYLMSRGLSESETVKLIVDGTFSDLYEGFWFGEDLKKRIEKIIW